MKILSKFSNLSEENPRPSKEGIHKVKIAANNVQLYIWLTAQVGLNQPQQVPMPMAHHQQSYNYSVNSDGSTFTSF